MEYRVRDARYNRLHGVFGSYREAMATVRASVERDPDLAGDLCVEWEHEGGPAGEPWSGADLLRRAGLALDEPPPGPA